MESGGVSLRRDHRRHHVQLLLVRSILCAHVPQRQGERARPQGLLEPHIDFDHARRHAPIHGYFT